MPKPTAVARIANKAGADVTIVKDDSGLLPEYRWTCTGCRESASRHVYPDTPDERIFRFVKEGAASHAASCAFMAVR